MINYEDCNCTEGITMEDKCCEECNYWDDYSYDNSDYNIRDEEIEFKIVEEFRELFYEQD